MLRKRRLSSEKKKKGKHIVFSPSPTKSSASQTVVVTSPGVNKASQTGRKKVLANRKQEKKEAPVVKTLNEDVLRVIARKLGKNSTTGLNVFAQVSNLGRSIAESEIQRNSKETKIIDVHQLATNKNPLCNRFYDCHDNSHVKEFHAEIRRVVTLLEQVAAGAGDRAQLVNFNVRSLGWLFNYADSELRRCPPLLQKRIMKLLRHHFGGTQSFAYAKSFLRPSRFVKTFSNRLETVTVLDLGDMKALKATGLRAKIFPALENLRELTWHRAETWFVQCLPSPHRLTSLSLTLRQGQMDAETLSVLLNCQGLCQLYTGFPVPDEPTRFDLDVLLRSYQGFWNLRQYIPEQMLTEKGVEPVPLFEPTDDGDYALRAFPDLEHAAFWNAPEYLFAIMAKRNIKFETLQFGQLNQDQTRLCSMDSLMQALFKFNQPKYELYQLSVKHLKLYVHAMPVVSLDYYLPQLMDGLGACLSSIRSLDLFVHCSFGASMPSSWSLEAGQLRKSQPKLDHLTRLSLHMDGFCVLDDLDSLLPESLSDLSLSFVIPAQKRKAFLTSLLRFLQLLADVNRFPELDRLHIQVWGIRCFEPILNKVVDCISGLRRLSVLCMPVREDSQVLKDLIGACVNKCPKLSEFSLCPDLLKLLIDSKPDEKKKQNASPAATMNWRQQLAVLREECHVEREQCQLSANCLPETDGWNRFDVQPEYTPVSETAEQDESEEEEVEESSEESDSNTNDEDEEDSIVQEEIVEDDSEDELDRAERRLREESRRRDNRWKTSRARIESEGSEGSTTGDVVVFKKRRKGEVYEESEDEDEEEHEQNPFLDDEAVEASGTSSGEESEPEMAEVEGSDDEELLANVVERLNTGHQPPVKRKKIIVSDSE